MERLQARAKLQNDATECPDVRLETQLTIYLLWTHVPERPRIYFLFSLTFISVLRYPKINDFDNFLILCQKYILWFQVLMYDFLAVDVL